MVKTGIEKRFQQAKKYRTMLEELCKMMKAIKSSGMYSNKEMNLDIERIAMMEVTQQEEKALMDGWDARKILATHLMDELISLSIEVKKEIKKMGDKKE